MSGPSLAEINQQLESSNARDRLLAVVALRAMPSQEAFPLIKKVLYDEHLPVRSLAILTLGSTGIAEAFDPLVRLLNEDEDYGIRAEAAGALGTLADRRAFEPLVHAFFEDDTWLVRFSVTVALGNLKDERAYPVLLRALEASEAVIQMAAIGALAEIKVVDAVDRILAFATSEDWLIRRRLAESLGELPSAKSLQALKYLSKDENFQVAITAERSLSTLQKISE
jgi:HEAT repeat protein